MTTEHYHLIGIGGAGMAPVAELLAVRGLRVSGSDARDSATLARLRTLGIDALAGHDAERVTPDATVVVSTAVRPDNPELQRARELQRPVIHRSQALVRAAEGRDFVAVAGAHGKTSTSAMLAVALRELGHDPSYAIGGTVLDLGTGAHLGAGRAFVAEADESDGSFLNYAPVIAVVTNIEPDHLDHYGSQDAFERAFVSFAERVTGLLVLCADDPGALRLARAVAGTRPVLTYGTVSDPGVGRGHVQVTDVELRPDGARALLRHHGEDAPPARLDLAVPGAHSLLNATAAWCVGVELGAPPQAMADALGHFTGTGRRFETRGEAGGVRVVDDYAHHPTEVAATLRTARLTAGAGRVVALFQPHLYSRTLAFAAQFAEALALADDVVVTGIFGAREDPVDGVDGRLVTDLLPGARYVAGREDAARTVADSARPGDLVLTIGAGDVTELGPIILAHLAGQP